MADAASEAAAAATVSSFRASLCAGRRPPRARAADVLRLLTSVGPMHRLIVLVLFLLAGFAGCDSESSPSTTVVECDHGLPRALCPRCIPELEAAYRHRNDWCAEHGLPESMCPLCDPGEPGEAEHGTHDSDEGEDVTAGAWCAEHAVPESHCTVCDPSLVPRFRAAGDWCDEHGFPESVCPTCHPVAPPRGAEEAAIEARIVRLASGDHERSAGITTVLATESRSTPTIACTARLTFDADRVAEVRALVPGVVRHIRVELGQRVDRGDALFVLESTEVGEVQGQLLASRQRVASAEADVGRKRALLETGAVSAREMDLAERELAAARAAARSAGASLRMTGAAPAAPDGRTTLRASLPGIVVRRPAVVGLLASEDTTLATIADTSVMWALCDVPADDAVRIAVGQPMDVRVDGLDESFPGEITWIAAEVDPRTRTVAARAELANPDGRLRAHQFARASIETGPPRAGVTVPREAVQRVMGQEVVFVRTGDGVYEPRVVHREGRGEQVSVEGRVSVGDAVVTTGAVLLRTEVMPGSVGAGCCEVPEP